MKVRFSFGAREERSFRFEAGETKSGKKRTRSFDTSRTEDNDPLNRDARSFAEGLLTIFATAAKEMKDLINDYEADHGSDKQPEGPADSGPDAPAGKTSQGPMAAPDEPDSPCATALSKLDLGERSIQWHGKGDSRFGVIEVLDSDDQLELWQAAREALRPGGCYPLLVDRDSLEFLEPQLRKLASFESSAGTDQRMSSLRRAYFDRNPWPAEYPIVGSTSHQNTDRRFGRAPTETELPNDTFETQDQVDEYLWRWELETFGPEAVIAAGEPEAIDWFEFDAGDTAMLVLPVADSASVIRFTGFFPTDDHPEWIGPLSNDIASWDQAFGAELVANYLTMLQFVVARPPEDVETAYQLAQEHSTVGTATLPLPGIETRHYAADLVGRTRWHLHDRP